MRGFLFAFSPSAWPAVLLRHSEVTMVCEVTNNDFPQSIVEWSRQGSATDPARAAAALATGESLANELASFFSGGDRKSAVYLAWAPEAHSELSQDVAMLQGKTLELSAVELFEAITFCQDIISCSNVANASDLGFLLMLEEAEAAVRA